MKRSKTPSFVLELPLGVTPGQERILLGRFEAARRLYNAVLGEALRSKALRESRAWQKARYSRTRRSVLATFRKLGRHMALPVPPCLPSAPTARTLPDGRVASVRMKHSGPRNGRLPLWKRSASGCVEASF